VGSVGQPRDSNRDAAYVTFDAPERSVTLHRVPYDLAATQRREPALPVLIDGWRSAGGAADCLSNPKTLALPLTEVCR
jgi:hypothetical protein